MLIASPSPSWELLKRLIALIRRLGPSTESTYVPITGNALLGPMGADVSSPSESRKGKCLESTYRVVTWNCRGASLNSPAWDYLLQLSPDIAILQDFRRIPDRVLDVYTIAPDSTPANGESRSPRHFAEVLVKGTVSRKLSLPASEDWIASELHLFRDFLTARYVTLQNGASLTVMSVYSPASCIDSSRLEGIDTSSIRLSQHSVVFVTELLWATLSLMNFNTEERFVVAGDFNSSETFDNPKPRGNREIMERLNILGLRECLRTAKGQLTPTFRTPRGGYIVHQLDHMYVTDRMLNDLVACDVGSTQRVFDSKPTLSDHLPIVADFAISP